MRIYLGKKYVIAVSDDFSEVSTTTSFIDTLMIKLDSGEYGMFSRVTRDDIRIANYQLVYYDEKYTEEGRAKMHELHYIGSIKNQEEYKEMLIEYFI